MPIPLLPVAVVGALALLLLARSSSRTPEAPWSQPEPSHEPLPGSGTIAGYDYTVRYVGGPPYPDGGTPVVVLFHGLGGNPELLASWLEPYLDGPVVLVLPRGKNRYGRNPAWWLERAGSDDQETLAAQMEWTARDLRPFLEAVWSAYGEDLVLTGHSQGGMAAALMATHHDDLVKGAVSAAPWVPPPLWDSDMAPVYAVHGVDDRTIPYDRTKVWLDTMASEGAAVTLEPVDGGHGLSGALRDAWGRAVNSEIASY